MKTFSFHQAATDQASRARTGIIFTPHGEIKTPAFVPVGTQGSIKSLSTDDITSTGAELWFINTYHMYLRPGAEIISRLGGLHGFTGWQRPLITDSGGFQVFSLGAKRLARLITDSERSGKSSDEGVIVPLVRIGDDGVTFQSHWDGTTHRFTPEKSLEVQSQLGADMTLVFDECTPYPTDGTYARISLDRTHNWALRSLSAHIMYQKKRKQQGIHPQALYGIVQGSIYEALRKESARYINSLGFDGIAIGGVSVGEPKSDMRLVTDWVVPLLDPEKPRHLLGVGEIDDIFALVKRGMDTFDCVQPTRLARVGYIYCRQRQDAKGKRQNETQKSPDYLIDLNKSEHAADPSPLDPNCSCWACVHTSRAYLHHLFRVKELLAYRLATIHNISFIQSLMADIRSAIREGTFTKFEKAWGIEE